MAWRDRWVDRWVDPWEDRWVDPWEAGLYLDSSPIYGILWNRASSSPTLQRIDENGDTIMLSQSNFDAHPLWGEIKRCQLDSAGNPTYGDNARGDGLTLTSDYIMAEIPGCYAGSYREGDYQGLLYGTRQFSSPHVTSVWHPAFWRRDRTGVKSPKLYVGSYEASNNGGTVSNDATTATKYATSWTNLKLTSKSGVAPLTGNGTSGTLAQFETAAKLIGTNWGITSFWTRMLIQGLMYVEFASFNMQSAIAPGRTNASNTSALASGQGNSLMGTNGTGGGTAQQAVCYRGIENPWGNIYNYVIGFNALDSAYNIMKRDGTGALAAILAAGNYEQTTGITPLNGTTNISGTDEGEYCHGYVSDLIFSDPLKLAFIPSALSGSETTYLTDYYYSHKAGISQTGILLAGGHWNGNAWYDAGAAGVGSLDASMAASDVFSRLGARLEAIF